MPEYTESACVGRRDEIRAGTRNTIIWFLGILILVFRHLVYACDQGQSLLPHVVTIRFVTHLPMVLMTYLCTPYAHLAPQLFILLWCARFP
ncbi:hypothetical protein EDB89DRAFT_1967375 [Lactarius sanguifluus]|nr:hypothetical protein EDB89DRAFT_1967375 [Lactarius sanguifluus]